MESGHRNGSNLRTNPSKSSSEGEQFNSKKKLDLPIPPFTSQDHIHFMPDATTTKGESATFLPSHLDSELHHTSPMMEKSDEISINRHLEPNLTNPFGETHLSLSSSSSQNPFLLLDDDATNITHVNPNKSENLHELQVPFETSFHQPSFMQHENGSITNSTPLGEMHMHHGHSSNDDMHGHHSSFPPSTYESTQENPFQVVEHHHDHVKDLHNHHYHTLPTIEQDYWNFPSHESTTTHHHHQSNHTYDDQTHASSPSKKIEPLFTIESTQNQKPDNISKASESSTQHHMHDSINISSKAKEDTNANATQKFGKDFHLASESSDDDIPISSMPKHEQKHTSDVVVVPETIQNPPIQTMERQEDDPAATSSSTQRIPLHVFSRSKSNTQWSTLSNESLFSIHMGNTSFSNEMAWLNKPGEMDNKLYGGVDDQMNTYSGGFPSNQLQPPPILPPQTQGTTTKFNDISQRTAEQHEGCLKVTEQKAVETMREVIMESSVTPKNKTKEDSTLGDGSTRSDKLSKSIDCSQNSDGSTKSFAFKV